MFNLFIPHLLLRLPHITASCLWFILLQILMLFNKVNLVAGWIFLILTLTQSPAFLLNNKLTNNTRGNSNLNWRKFSPVIISTYILPSISLSKIQLFPCQLLISMNFWTVEKQGDNGTWNKIIKKNLTEFQLYRRGMQLQKKKLSIKLSQDLKMNLSKFNPSLC